MKDIRAEFKLNPIVRLREAAGLSRAQMGRKTGLPYMTITNIERGATNTMTPTTAERLAKALGTTAQCVKEVYEAYRQAEVAA